MMSAPVSCLIHTHVHTHIQMYVHIDTSLRYKTFAHFFLYFRKKTFKKKEGGGKKKTTSCFLINQKRVHPNNMMSVSFLPLCLTCTFGEHPSSLHSQNDWLRDCHMW